MITFDVTLDEARLISKIAGRASAAAKEAGIDYPKFDAEMDVTACHVNDCSLDLERLLAAGHGDFGHDVFGIRKFLNRQTGKLDGHFVPRCTRKISEVK